MMSTPCYNNTMQKMVDRQRYQMMSPFKDILHVELDIGPVVCSRAGPGPSPLSSPLSSSLCLGGGEFSSGSWRHGVEDVLWLASAFFILFYGDFRSNFFSVLASDPRIRRAPLLYGLVCLVMDSCMMLLFLTVQPQLKQAKRLYNTAAASTIFTVVGVAAFVMLSIALWPVWYILTIPLLFTLFMASMVLISYPLSWSVRSKS
eukprot:c18772_g1_i1 orf=74-682(+)